MALLQSVALHGSISAAARELGLSYRHVWGELKRWETSLGQSLIVWEKGQSARLTEFGTKLMWAERQTQARLAPHIQALRADLERTFAIAFDPQAHVLTCYASHDAALSQLQGTAAGQGLHLDLRFCGSVDAIRALNEGRCLIAGFHVPLHPQADSLSARTFRPLLQPGKHKLIGFADRSQGLMVPAGNPLGLDTLARVSQQRARLALRDKGSGTRLLFDAMASEAGLTLSDFELTAQEEPSHLACAVAVAAGQADVALGIASAAREQGLDFVPLDQERYYLVCLKSAIESPALQALRQLLLQANWQQQLMQLPGYQVVQAGQVQSLRTELPWWQLRPKKMRQAGRVADSGALSPHPRGKP
jgi:putative molybdopterin biosynthesis protein